MLPSSGFSGTGDQTWCGNTDFLHLLLEMNHPLKGYGAIIQGLEFNVRQIGCPCKTGTRKQALVERKGSAVM